MRPDGEPDSERVTAGLVTRDVVAASGLPRSKPRETRTSLPAQAGGFHSDLARLIAASSSLSCRGFARNAIAPADL